MRPASRLLAVGMSFTFLSLPALGETVDSNGSLAVRQVTVGATGGPFVFELTDGADGASRPTRRVDDGRRRRSRRRRGPRRRPRGGHVHGASGSGAIAGRARRAGTGSSPASNATARRVTVDAPTGTATITLDPGASATCTVTDTWVADRDAAATDAAPATGDRAASGRDPPATDDVVVQQSPGSPTAHNHGEEGRHPHRSDDEGAVGRRDVRDVREPRRTRSTTPIDSRSARHSPTDSARWTFRDRHAGTSGSAKSTAPAGYFRLDTISTGTSSTTGDNTTATPYIERVNVRNNNSYMVPPSISPSPGGGYRARSFANGLNNPQLTPTCGSERGDGLRRLVVDQRAPR